jgi:Flp pilus assembly protein TadG
MQRLQSHIERLRSESGTSTIEFAIVVPLLLLILFGIIDYAKAWNYTNDMTHVANTGARFAAVNNNPGAALPTAETLQQYIASQSESAELRNGGSSSIPNRAFVCIDFPDGTAAAGHPVRVRVRAEYAFIPFLPNWMGGSTSVNLTGSSTMRLEQTPTNYSTADNPAGCSTL